MYTLFTFKQGLSSFSEATSKNSNMEGFLTAVLVVAGMGLGIGFFWLYKKISHNNVQLQREIDRTKNEIKKTNEIIDEVQEETDITHRSIDRLNEELQIAQRELEKINHQYGEVERIMTELESGSSYKSATKFNS